MAGATVYGGKRQQKQAKKARDKPLSAPCIVGRLSFECVALTPLISILDIESITNSRLTHLRKSLKLPEVWRDLKTQTTTMIMMMVMMGRGSPEACSN